jgi:lipopolysaccharide export system protein LptA
MVTRGDSIIRGRRVVLNLVTGQSTVDSGDGEAGDGRVRGLFVPRQRDR